VENPFESDFNPGDPLGQKLFMEATTFDIKDEDKLTINYENTTKILDLLNSLSRRYDWSRLVHKVKVGGDVLSILCNHRIISIEDVQRQAESYFAPGKYALNPITGYNFQIEQIDPENDEGHRRAFFDRVKSTIIATGILQHLSPASIKSLSLDKSTYTWRDQNGNE